MLNDVILVWLDHFLCEWPYRRQNFPDKTIRLVAVRKRTPTLLLFRHNARSGRFCAIISFPIFLTHDGTTMSKHALVLLTVLAFFLSQQTRTLAQSISVAFDSQVDVALMIADPRPVPEHLRKMFDRMEAANRLSQDVFRQLSVEQMNFNSSNGTHTPRWNAEHMSGRQLLFFSQIYHALDPNIPIFDWNPKQMPMDYEARHPTWSGADEARAMQRVDDFSRRYAYLLNDIQLNDEPPATFWPSFKALLLQMEEHYAEHTANVKKKFELPDWPKE